MRKLTCYRCGKEYFTLSSEEEMLEECNTLFHTNPTDEEHVEVCDPCFKELMKQYKTLEN